MTLRAYLLGDSHAQVLGPVLQALLQPKYDLTYEAFPGFGTMRAAAAAHIPAKLDLAVVVLGGNDFGNQRDARAALVRRLQKTGAKVYWFGPAHSLVADVDARHAEQAASQAAQLPGLGVHWYDSRPWTAEEPHVGDGVHFTHAGYEGWGTHIAKAVKGGKGILAWLGLLGLGVLGMMLLPPRRRW